MVMQLISLAQKKSDRILLGFPSAWAGLENILEDLLEKYGVRRDIALEFGVQFGFSMIALSNFFKKVVGVDTFVGDTHSSSTSLEAVRANCCYDNIELVESDYKDFIAGNDQYYDLIHIDMDHSYEQTYKCGEWALDHSPIVIFHDTCTFPEVKRAVEALSNGEYDNYPHVCGLGIVKSQLEFYG